MEIRGQAALLPQPQGPSDRRYPDFRLLVSRRVKTCVQCGRAMPIAAYGKCVTCYRKQREAENPDVLK
jgi:hypothetical protein